MAIDKVNPIVKEALLRDGWDVEERALTLAIGKDQMEIDIQAEKLISATKGLKKIAVEAKTFGRRSVIYSFHEALGQYMNYLLALELLGENRELYLAVDLEVYKLMLDNVFIKASLDKYHIKLLIFSTLDKSIEKWIE